MSGARGEHLPEPWLLLPAIAAYGLLAVALRDPVLAPASALALVAAYVHGRSLPPTPRHAWVVVAFAGVGAFYLTVLGGGKGLSAVTRMLPYSEHVVAFSGLLLAVGIVWLWHIRIPTAVKPGLIFAAAALIAVMSGNYYGPGRGYSLAMALYFVAVVVASAMSGTDVRTPLRERWVRAGVCLGLLGIVGAGTWVTALGLRAAERGLLTVPFGSLSLQLPVFTGLGRGNGILIQTKVRVRPSNRLVATVEGPAPGYLRTQVMSSYTSGHWRARVGDDLPVATAAGAEHRYRIGKATGPSGGRRVVTMRVDLGGALPLPYGAVSLDTDDPVALRVDSHAGVVRVEPSWSLESYTVDSGSDDRSQLAATLDRIEAPEAVLARLRPLATRITAGASSPLAAARLVEQYFHDNFEYSLNVDLARDGDPVVDFVLNRRPAFCEHFASGMALMLLAVDIPARVVGGFSVEEQNLVTDAWLVRQRDAHAWTEVYDAATTSWVRFDATPPGVTALRGAGGPAGWLRQALESAASWPRMLGKWWTSREFGQRLRVAYSATVEVIRRAPLVWLVVLAAGFLLLSRRRDFAHWLGRQLRNRRALAADAGAPAQARAAFERVARELEERGRPIGPTETLTDYLGRVTPDAELARFAALYHELRFDPHADADRLPDLRQRAALRSVERARAARR